MLPMPLSLGFSTTDRTSATSGAPVAFGAIAFRGNATGGGSAPYTVDLSGSAAATTVTPQINSFPGAGGGIGGDVLNEAIPQVLGMATGLNGAQVQDPARATGYGARGTLPAAELAGEGDGGSGGGLPIVGIAVLAAAALAAMFIVGR